MLIDLGVNSRAVYEEDFEKKFLESSSAFYRVESQEFIASNSCSDYMRKVRRHSIVESICDLKLLIFRLKLELKKS